jgi:excisionase family DNA binding protein
MKGILINYQDVLTPAQVAEILQVSEQTVYKLLNTKQLKSRRIGRYWRINKTDLISYIGM